MLLVLWAQGSHPWNQAAHVASVRHAADRFHGYGFVLFVILLGVLEAAFGLYGPEWDRNEKALDLTCFLLPKLVFAPFFAWFSLTVLPFLLPHQRNLFSWVPFFWGFLILCVADDLTQYWYHRVHHEIPWLWRFHRTHHSAPYMGMSMAGRQNAFYSIFFSQTYVTSILVYLGLGPAAVVVLTVKSTITTLAHSSIPWDKPFYRYRPLKPLGWILERLISTPATHHAHHASTTDDGVGFYKGNFGNMFFLWDVIFKTAHISRRYPKEYGISHYENDPWYSQLLWPVLKSNVVGSELASDGPVVRTDSEPALEMKTSESLLRA
jgi:sterol desaturase/sphingolipid hydroxylase (fatty acid hydroxylase superfamily)